MDNAASVTPAPAFSAVPLAEPAKRGRGRPRKDGTTGDTAPRSPGAGSRSRTLEKDIGALLVTLNLPLTMFLPVDALDEVEIPALAVAIDEQCKRSPVFRGYVLRVLKVQSATSLFAVVAMIGARRAARHGIIPEAMNPAGIDAGMGAALAMMSGGKAVDTGSGTPVWTPPLEPVTESTDLSDRFASGKTSETPPISAVPVWTPPVEPVG